MTTAIAILRHHGVDVAGGLNIDLEQQPDREPEPDETWELPTGRIAVGDVLATVRPRWAGCIAAAQALDLDDEEEELRPTRRSPRRCSSTSGSAAACSLARPVRPPLGSTPILDIEPLYSYLMR